MKLEQKNLITIKDEFWIPLIKKDIKYIYPDSQIITSNGTLDGNKDIAMVVKKFNNPLRANNVCICIIKTQYKNIQHTIDAIQKMRPRTDDKVVCIVEMNLNRKYKNTYFDNVIDYRELEKPADKPAFLTLLEIVKHDLHITNINDKEIYNQYKPYLGDFTLSKIYNDLGMRLVTGKLGLKKDKNRNNSLKFRDVLLKAIQKNDITPLQLYCKKRSIEYIGQRLIDISDSRIKKNNTDKQKPSPEQLSKIHYHYLQAKQTANDDITIFTNEFIKSLANI